MGASTAVACGGCRLELSSFLHPPKAHSPTDNVQARAARTVVAFQDEFALPAENSAVCADASFLDVLSCPISPPHKQLLLECVCNFLGKWLHLFGTAWAGEIDDADQTFPLADEDHPIRSHKRLVSDSWQALLRAEIAEDLGI